MARDLVLNITVYDKGNVTVKNLTANVAGLDKATWNLGKTLNRVFVASTFLMILNKFKEGISTTISEVTKFENTTRRIEGVAQISGSALSKLSQQSIALSNSTEFMATEIQGATLALAKLGIPAEIASKILPTVADVTTATGLEMSRVAVIVLDTMKQFSLDYLSIAEVQRTANVLFQVEAQTSIQSFEEIAESMKYVAPVATAMGYSLEETSSILGTLANRGIKGTLAGNAMKNMFLNILSATGKTKVALMGMNIETMSFADILAELKARGIDVNGFLETFKKRAVIGALAVAGASEETNKFTKELENQTLKVSDVAATIRDSWVNQLKRLGNTFVNLGNTWQLVMDSSFTVNPLTVLIESFIDLQEWMLANRELIVKFSNDIAKALKLVSTVIGSLTTFGVKNFDLLTHSMIVFGAQAILFNKRFVAGTTAMKNFNEKAKNTGKIPLGGILTNWNFIILGLITSIELLSLAFDRWNAKLDKTTASVADTSLEGMKNKLAAMKEYMSLKYIPEEKMGFEVGYANKNFQKKYSEGAAKLQQIYDKYNLPKGFFENIDFSEVIPRLEKFILEQEKIITDSNDRITKAKLDAENLLAKQLRDAQTEEGRKQAQAWIDAYVAYLEYSAAGVQGAFARMAAGIHPIEPRLLSDKESVGGITQGALKSMNTKELMTSSYMSTQETKSLNLGDLPSNVQKPLEFVMSAKIVLAQDAADKVKEEISKIKLAIDKKDFKIKVAEFDVTKTSITYEDTKKEILDLNYKDVLENQNNIVKAYELTNQIVTGFDDLRHDKMMNNLSREEEALNRKYSRQMELARGSSEKQKLIQMKYDADMRKLNKKKEKEEKEYKEKQKTWSIVDILIKGAVAFIAALQVPGPAGWIMAGLTAAATTAAAIFAAAQKYAGGGLIKGKGNGTSDSVPMWGSAGEYMVKKDIVDALGGEYGVKSMIDDRLGNSFTSGRNIYINIDTLIDTPEYERELFIRLKKEARRW